MMESRPEGAGKDALSHFKGWLLTRRPAFFMGVMPTASSSSFAAQLPGYGKDDVLAYAEVIGKQSCATACIEMRNDTLH